MGWTKQQSKIENQHACERPEHGESVEHPVTVGDLWTCDECGCVWRAYHVSTGNFNTDKRGVILGWRPHVFQPPPMSLHDLERGRR